MIDYDKFQQSLKRLEEQQADYRAPDAGGLYQTMSGETWD